MNAYIGIYERYADEAPFLWLLRSIAVSQPHYRADELLALEKRIDAQLDGLMTSLEDAWKICAAAMDVQQPGEIFTSSVLAFRSLDVDKIQRVVESGMASDEGFPGLVSALGWLPGFLCHSWIKRFLTSKDLNHKYLAIAACSIRREDPREYLARIFERADCMAHSALYARALRLVGEIKRHDLSFALRIAMSSEVPEVFFWARWSAILLGDRSVVRDLQSIVLAEGPYQSKAIELVFRALPIEEARAWVGLLVKDESQIRNAIKAVAVLGDPHAVPWLIGHMRAPGLERLAGEAFTTITGIDLEACGLVLDELPDLEGQVPNDDPSDDNVELDDDEHLPFPDLDKVIAIWQRDHGNFISGQRYLLGKTISSSHLTEVFSGAPQRQRRAAALELALLEPTRPLPNWEVGAAE